PVRALRAEPGPTGAAPTPPAPAPPPRSVSPGRIVDQGKNSSVNATINATAIATDVRSPNAGRAELGAPIGELLCDDPPLTTGCPSPPLRSPCMRLPSARGRAALKSSHGVHELSMA